MRVRANRSTVQLYGLGVAIDLQDAEHQLRGGDRGGRATQHRLDTRALSSSSPNGLVT